MVAGEFDVAGDILTGGVIARAVEPDQGEGKATDGNCLNCGYELLGRHCHGCGQKANVHRTLRSYGHDLLHGVFHFEGKVWKTLPMLVFKPGELTRRYIHGERAKFVSPLALFLFAVFLMFAVVGGLAGEMQVPDNSSEVMAKFKDKPLSELEAQLKTKKAEQAALNAQIREAANKVGNTDALENRRNATDKEIEDIEDAKMILQGKKPFRVTDATTGIPRIDAAIQKANENPNLLLYKMQTSAYKYSWALIPLSIPFVWLLYFWRREFKLYDHAVFVTYSLTFMLFLVVILTVAGFAGLADPWVPIAGTFIPPLHMYRQLRGAYQGSRLGAILRTLILSMFATIVLSLFLVILVLLGVLG